jgi:hypothetical protein
MIPNIGPQRHGAYESWKKEFLPSSPCLGVSVAKKDFELGHYRNNGVVSTASLFSLRGQNIVHGGYFLDPVAGLRGCLQFIFISLVRFVVVVGNGRTQTEAGVEQIHECGSQPGAQSR